MNTQRFTDNVFIVEDLNDTIGYENAVQSAKSLFKQMFPDDPWMEKDKPAVPKETRADQVFGALEENKKSDDQDNDTKKAEKEEEEEAVVDREKEEQAKVLD